MYRFSYSLIIPIHRCRQRASSAAATVVSGLVCLGAISYATETTCEESNFTKVIADIGSFLREDQIELDKSELENRGKPWNSYHKSLRNPDVIIYPESTEDVSLIVKTCYKWNVPIIPFGGGTSVEGQTLALFGGVSLDFSRMKAVLRLNEDDLDCVVQAGVGYLELNEQLRARGLWFPLDPGPGASVGGMVATRCSGSTAVRYGSMRENVLNVTAVLADAQGTVIHTGSRARKSSAGYDLTRLLVGSEGSLAVVTEVCLKVHRLPSHSAALRVSFPTVGAAAAMAREALVLVGVGSIARIELLDDVMVDMVNAANPGLAAWPLLPTLMFEVTGPSEASVTEQVQRLQDMAQSAHGGSHVICASDPAECAALWKVRKECLWLALANHPDREAMITDVCVPLSRLPELITATRTALDASSPHLPSPIVAHAGDGNFHALILVRPDCPEDVAEAHRLADEMAERAIALGGTCTGEHGVGAGKKRLLRLEMGPGAMGLMELIKRAVDPRGILNPGKVLDTQPPPHGAGAGGVGCSHTHGSAHGSGFCS